MFLQRAINQNFFRVLFTFALLLIITPCLFAQDAAENRYPGVKPKEDLPKNLREMLSKKRIEQEKKEHDELLKRGEEALEISGQLEQSFEQHQQLSSVDKERLDYLAVLVKKIRKEIGAEDDERDNDANNQEAAVEEKPSNLEAAFKALQSTTVKLVDELKKTTRFSISAIAVQSSNTLLRIVRFIRSGK
nr:Unknown Function [uncultured bacterium]